jgi:hypothetical protein
MRQKISIFVLVQKLRKGRKSPLIPEIILMQKGYKLTPGLIQPRIRSRNPITVPVLYYAERKILLSTLEDFQGSISGTVIHGDQLKQVPGLLTEKTVQSRLKIMLPVKGGHDYRKPWFALLHIHTVTDASTREH